MSEDAVSRLPPWIRARAEVYARHPLVRRPLLRARFARFAEVGHDDAVLDVGCGPGFSTLALARRARAAAGADWRPELLAVAERQLRRRRSRNVRFVEIEPARFHFPSGEFDVVTSAAALHHFPSPEATLGEMARVCREGGRVVLEDVVASEQEMRARYHNRIERLRDRSHHRLLSLSEVIALVGRSGLVVRRVEVHDSVREFNEWVGVTRPPTRRSEHIRHLLQGSVEQDLSGLDVQPEDDTFLFTQHVAWVLAIKEHAS